MGVEVVTEDIRHEVDQLGFVIFVLFVGRRM